MTVRRLYAPGLPEEGGAVVLGEASSRHVRVLRLQVGETVVLFDGEGRAATARVESIANDVVCVAEPPVAAATRRARLVLMLAIPKGSKLDDCVRAATELGVDEVLLMQTERTVPRWDSERTRARLDRLTRIASEAAAQCERDDMPVVHAPRPPCAWLEEMPATAKGLLFSARAEGAVTLERTTDQVWCALGPEGGFTEDEVLLFERSGFSVASLGTRVLRVETAVPAALAIVADRLGDVRQAR
ncbi:MAG: 16S rRNA (uracil(1498)-N(3))-methyltransferase [Deltaproteobacteria bacterium]|nr:16S rRNA (uracil(1498)-N(3))-methyltransferase [Deltaproteobacteria bacterium]